MKIAEPHVITDAEIDKMQRDYIWKELLTTETLVGVVGHPFNYSIPTDCLRPMGAKMPVPDTPETWIGASIELTYDVVGQDLVLSYETTEDLDLFFVRRDDDPTKWSSELEESVALCVAMRACFLVTDNQNLMQQLTGDLLSLTLPKARELQSRYSKNYAKLLPSGFSNLQARLA